MAIVTETAEVVAVEDEYAWVETRRKAVCDACAVQKGCGSGIISRMFSKRARVRVPNTLGARVGEQVVIGIEDSALVRASLAVYLMPLVWMLLGALAGQMTANALGWSLVEGATALSGLLGLGAGFLWLRRYAHNTLRDPARQPNLLRFADPDEDRNEAVVMRERRLERHDRMQNHGTLK
jgi:sigma-E factor negative regulatory protein RseC